MVQALDGIAVGIQNGRAGTDVHHRVLVAVLYRHILREEVHLVDPVPSGIAETGLGGPQPAVLTQLYRRQSAGLSEVLVIQAFMDLTHDLLPQHRRRVIAGIDPLRGLITHPHSRSIIGRIAHKPAVVVGGGGTGLTGHRHARDTGGGTGTVAYHVLEHLIHIIGGLGGENDFFFRFRVIQQHLFHTVHLTGNLGVGPGLDIHAVPGEHRVGSRHIHHANTVGQTAQSHLAGAVVILDLTVAQIGLLQVNVEILLHKVKGSFRPHLLQNTHRHRVGGHLHSGIDRNITAVGLGIVQGPVLSVEHTHRFIGIDRSRGNHTQLNGRRIDRQGLDGGTGLTDGAAGHIEHPVGRLFA